MILPTPDEQNRYRLFAIDLWIAAIGRFRDDLPVDAFDDLLEFSGMLGGDPDLMPIILGASSWRESVSLMMKHAGFPEEMW